MTDSSTAVVEEVSSMDIHQVLAMLPHRYPFLMIDRVERLEVDQSIVALKNVTINEPFFQGHFPHHPVMPGVLILEAFAQAAGVLVGKSTGTMADESKVYYFVGVDKARFKRPVEPGDQLRLEVTLKREMRSMYFFGARATVNGEVACSADLMCAVRDIEA